MMRSILRPRLFSKKIFKEPLLHFLFLGALLFCLYVWQNPDASFDDSDRRVRISEGDVQWMKETWAKQWQRDPSSEELQGIVTDFLKEELLAREAKEMGLDKNDTYIRRRLAQKVGFLVQDASRLVEPTEDDLREFYADHRDRYQEEARVSFLHVYFKPENENNIAPALALLKKNANPTELGDRLLLNSEFHNEFESSLASQFGAAFAHAVFALDLGQWEGPISSGYGLHLVRLLDKKAARPLAFEDVRPTVRDDAVDAQKQKVNRQYFDGLLKKYDVVVDESVKSLVGVLGTKESME